MASIVKRGNSYRVKVSRNGKEYNQSFSNFNTAELWGKYKDDLIHEMAAFKVPESQLITLLDSIDLKIERCISDKLTERSIIDIRNLKNDFKELLDYQMSDLTQEVLENFCNKYIKTIITIGGGKNEDSGRKTHPSTATILSKLRRLSGVYSNLIDNGIKIQNMALLVANKIRNNLDK